MKDRKKDLYWTDDHDSAPFSSDVFRPLVSENTATSLKSAAHVTYPVHAVVLNSSVSYWRWLIENRLSLIGFRAAQLETIGEDDAESNFKNNSAHF